jgi:Ran GTPase-activating protein (RanGAP) involved in mRNA processing and transport
LFYYHPHPANQHVKLYERELADILNLTTISHIDLSDNNITGHSSRELHGLTYFMKTYAITHKAFSCRASNLNSQGIFAITHGLGVFSTLTYLDISDNMAGLDPAGAVSTEGIMALALQAAKSLQLQVLKLARNRLCDEHIVLLGDAIMQMPQFLDLDLAGNLCRMYGCRGLKQAIASHGVQHNAM